MFQVCMMLWMKYSRLLLMRRYGLTFHKRDVSHYAQHKSYADAIPNLLNADLHPFYEEKLLFFFNPSVGIKTSVLYFLHNWSWTLRYWTHGSFIPPGRFLENLDWNGDNKLVLSSRNVKRLVKRLIMSPYVLPIKHRASLAYDDLPFPAARLWGF